MPTDRALRQLQCRTQLAHRQLLALEDEQEPTASGVRQLVEPVVDGVSRRSQRQFRRVSVYPD